MSPQTGTEPIPQAIPTPRWSLGSRVAFRFCFLYFGLFCLTTQVFAGLLVNPKVDLPDLAGYWPVRPIVFWTAAHIFQVKYELIFSGSGSGDKTFDWVLAFCLLVCAALITGIWSVLDRKRENYAALHRWFHLFIRFALVSQLLVYGMDKAVPLQMPFPSLTRLLEPYGNFSPMGVLWSSIGASRPYEIFAGCAELLGGILLIFPRTAMFGALICVADLTQVFMLNMTYDVPVKLFSFHLLLMALFLLAPEFPRLFRFFFLNRVTEASTQPPLYRSRRGNRIALTLQCVFGLWLLAMNAYSAWIGWNTFGGARRKSPLYGIWDVKQISVDKPASSPYDQWRRAIFDFPTIMAIQRRDDSFANYTAQIDTQAKTIALTRSGAGTSGGNLTFQRIDGEHLTLDGAIDSQKIHIELQRVDITRFPLVNRGFHWIQERPFNR